MGFSDGMVVLPARDSIHATLLKDLLVKGVGFELIPAMK